MINLAPLRYAHVLTEAQGPIQRVELTRVEWDGETLFEAHAYLSPELNLKKWPPGVMGAADGTGLNPSAMVARHLAISEALERWALYFLFQSGNRADYGLDRDSTSTGMAAFPGPFASQARSRALTEAAERFCLAGWWAGLLPEGERRFMPDGTLVLEIENPLGRDHVILVNSKTESGHAVYGFAASPNPKAALLKAKLEMCRMARALEPFFQKNPGFQKEDLSVLENPLERRLVYFALPEGRQAFQARLQGTASGLPSASPMRPLIDTRLPGPWDRYTTVWRVLYPMPSTDYLGPREDVLFW